MCTIRNYRYSCNHFVSFRLSTCRGTFGRRNPATRAACSSSSCLDFDVSSVCGPCQLAKFNADWESRLQQARAARGSCYDTNEVDSAWSNGPSEAQREGDLERFVDVSAALDDLQDEYDKESWLVALRFPAEKTQVYGRPSRNTRVMRGSLLHREVFPDGVVIEDACVPTLSDWEQRKADEWSWDECDREDAVGHCSSVYNPHDSYEDDATDSCGDTSLEAPEDAVAAPSEESESIARRISEVEAMSRHSSETRRAQPPAHPSREPESRRDRHSCYLALVQSWKESKMPESTVLVA
ncbi:hypothetical protein LTR16_001754 [Cryomyces antarcticus]|uniref:Uncharacterized protein n=1 Tax=Cryomyces antarcticus TaxID=329879 RepID=A0ABR0LZ27_9PEZI|nr:hypothetical protein LTR60_001035 [Cryomyces antarcticus]KAK5257048.1 hypothetical protein LTR16_001754 [Cryomyces antarcticus]